MDNKRLSLPDKVATWAPGGFSAILMVVTLIYAAFAIQKEGTLSNGIQTL